MLPDSINFMSKPKTYIPIGRRVLVELPAESESGDSKIGGIIVPRTMIQEQKARDNPMLRLKVIARGPDCKQINEGDWIIINRNQFPVLPIDGRQLIFAEEEQIIAVEK